MCDIAFLPNAFQAQKCTNTPRRCSCNGRPIAGQLCACEELAQGPYTVTVSDEARTRTLHVLQAERSNQSVTAPHAIANPIRSNDSYRPIFIMPKMFGSSRAVETHFKKPRYFKKT